MKCHLANEVRADVTDQDVVDERSGEVGSRGRKMQSEMSDLLFLVYRSRNNDLERM